MSAWILLTVFYMSTGVAAQAIMYPSEELCERAATKIRKDVPEVRVRTSCTETKVMR